MSWRRALGCGDQESGVGVSDRGVRRRRHSGGAALPVASGQSSMLTRGRRAKQYTAAAASLSRRAGVDTHQPVHLCTHPDTMQSRPVPVESSEIAPDAYVGTRQREVGSEQPFPRQL